MSGLIRRGNPTLSTAKPVENLNHSWAADYRAFANAGEPS